MKINKITVHCAVMCFLIPLLCFFRHAEAQSKGVKVIEIRNYLLKPGQRDAYIEAFETLLMDTLDAHGNYVMGQYRVKGAKDNFVWIRGFDDMQARKPALESFFSSKHWEKHNYIPENFILGYTNVYLLKPLNISGQEQDKEIRFPMVWFGKPKGVAVMDFYVANEMLDQLVGFVSTKYDSLLCAVGIKDITYWLSEPSPNNYPDLPVFQDKNLLVTIAFFENEQEYQRLMNKVEASMDEEMKFTYGRIVTTRTNWILYPTARSYTEEVR